MCNEIGRRSHHIFLSASELESSGEEIDEIFDPEFKRGYAGVVAKSLNKPIESTSEVEWKESVWDKEAVVNEDDL